MTVDPINRLRADLTLLLVATIWGSAFVAQRLAAGQFGILLFNGLRFLLGALVLLPFVLRGRQANPAGQAQPNVRLGVLAAGGLLFAASGLQHLGLRYTTAGNAGLITGLYVVFIPVILAIGWRKSPRRAVWVAAGLAAVGLFLLSTGGHLRLAFGDLIELGGAILWALHVILIGWLVSRMDVLPLAAGQYLVCAALSLLAGLILEADTLPALPANAWAVAYTGLFSVGLGYTLQAAAQRVAPPADAAVLLSTEAVFAALFGWWFLGEVLTPIQLLGCGLILVGILVASLPKTAASELPGRPEAG